MDNHTNRLLTKFGNNERIIIGCALLFTLLITAFDVAEDYNQGADAINIVADLVYMSVMLGLLVYLWIFIPWTVNRSHRQLQVDLLETHQDAIQWRNKAKELIEGLSQLINEQFNEWSLSPAEKEVGLLLLKGLSVKQISHLRETSDQTVRQQATTLYAKSNLKGRAELAAFFLEDFLLPIEEKTNVEVE